MSNFEYIRTFDMSAEEIKRWEKENKACSIRDNDGCRIIELSQNYLYGQDYFQKNKEHLDEKFGTPTIGLAFYDDIEKFETFTSFSSVSEIRKLRDYLTEALNDFFPKEAGHEDEMLSISRDELEALKAKASKWDVINSAGIVARIADMLKHIDYALIECNSMQQLVIDAAGIEDFTNVQCATKRLMDITHDVFYNKEDLKRILE